MNNKVMYMTFYENWVEVMEMCTPEEWYELCKIITNLRFKGIDTDAKTISNIKIKMAWNLIRPSILKSNRDKRYNDTKRNGGNAEETKKSVITEVKTTEFDIPNCQIPNTADLSPSNDEDIPTPQQVEEKPTEAVKTTIEETIPNEFMEGLTDNTEEVKFDNFSDKFNNWLDDGKQEKLMEMARNIVKYEYMGIGVAKTAYELAKTRFQQMLESFDTQDEKDMLCRYFDELLMLKKENYKEFIKVA